MYFTRALRTEKARFPANSGIAHRKWVQRREAPGSIHREEYRKPTLSPRKDNCKHERSSAIFPCTTGSGGGFRAYLDTPGCYIGASQPALLLCGDFSPC